MRSLLSVPFSSETKLDLFRFFVLFAVRPFERAVESFACSARLASIGVHGSRGQLPTTFRPRASALCSRYAMPQRNTTLDYSVRIVHLADLGTRGPCASPWIYWYLFGSCTEHESATEAQRNDINV